MSNFSGYCWKLWWRKSSWPKSVLEAMLFVPCSATPHWCVWVWTLASCWVWLLLQFFQGLPAPVCLASAPCLLFTATSTKCATTPAAMTSPTGSPPLLPSPWCQWTACRSPSTSAAAPSVKHPPRLWPCTARISPSPSVPLVGAASG